MSGTGALGQVGAACFGIAVGYLTYRTLVRTALNASVSVVAAAVGALGGAAVTGLFAPDASLLSWNSHGLLAGFATAFGATAKVCRHHLFPPVQSEGTHTPPGEHPRERASDH